MHRWTRVLPTAVPAVSVQLDNTGGRVVRVAARETSGTTPAVIEVYDGTGTNGILLDLISLSPGESVRDRYEHWEYPFDGGLWLQVVSGTAKASFTVMHCDDWEHYGNPVIIIGNPAITVEAEA